MKYKILEALKNNPGNFISGESLSTQLGVTRTMVWKYIKDLRTQGYVIHSSSGKGYKLEYTPDILNAFEIRYGLSTKYLGSEIHFLKTIDSTNLYAKKIANEGCKDGALVVAETQTSGKGRMGRTWESKNKKGIWMSIVLKPEILPSHIQIITLAASVAVVHGIKKATGISTGIKWPNDIISDGKKVCGILTEMSSEPDRVNYIVLGIGINVNHDNDDFSDEIRHKATSLKILKYSDGDTHDEHDDEYTDEYSDEDIRKNDVIKAILAEFEGLYENIKNGETDVVLNQWREASLTLGMEVKIISGNCEFWGTALDITDDGKLIVRDTNDLIHELVSGEISIRGMDGYT
ncbi:MAG: biotin--[acetyl-CoA-carboxylase] ligase [Clostridiaceae bacterium]|nr:biotin--[acetyl-CoA-carboxylase] ligase [Clostridiaceae bacterium]